jgi:hypothetical protein
LNRESSLRPLKEQNCMDAANSSIEDILVSGMCGFFFSM